MVDSRRGWTPTLLAALAHAPASFQGPCADRALTAKGTELAATCWRIAARRAPIKAVVAVLVVIEHHPDHDLAHGHHRRSLRRPRTPLLNPAQPRESQASRHRTTTGDGIPGHPRSTSRA